MARTEARLFTSIWHDGDFRGLSATAQWLYGVVLLTQPDLSWCGVLPYSPRRWAGLARGVTQKSVVKALDELSKVRFIIVDRSTEEVWIRTFAKNDGVLKIPNLRKAMADSFTQIASQQIRQGFWEGLPEEFREEFAERVGKALPNPCPLTPLPFPESPDQRPRETRASSTNGGRDEQPDDAKESILSDTWALMAYRRMERRNGEPIVDKAAYVRKTVRELAKEFTEQALAALELDPLLDVENLAHLLDVSSAEGRPPCTNCDSTGWLPAQDELGGLVACPACNRVPA